MFRILMARNGYYYVQRQGVYGAWTKVGGFFSSRGGAKKFIDDYRLTTRRRCSLSCPVVVGYY